MKSLRIPVTIIAAALFAGTLATAPSHVHAQDDPAVTVVVTGDTGFSRNHSQVSARGVSKYGRVQPFAEALEGIAAQVNGDINFTNIETVVTDRNNLPRDTKGQGGPFNFRSHPASMTALVDRGFNVFSLANNHSMDYGRPGLEETLRHISAIPKERLRAYAGIGMNREEASRPQSIELRGHTLAFSAIGIVTNNLGRHRAGESSPGQIAYRFDDDYALSLKRLGETKADYRMLSIHYGIEGRVRADDMQLRQWRGQAARDSGIDLVIGHHAHVVRAVDRVGDKVIFYGLGNFIHHGTADMRPKGICKDYGLLGRVHLLPDANGRLRARAVEVVPLTNMHIRTEPLPPAKAAQRIHALNYLASRLPDQAENGTGMTFTPQEDGTGLYCFDGAANDPGRIGKLCRGWKPAPAIPAGLRGRIAGSCSS